MSNPSRDELLLVGEIAGPFGVRGQLKMLSYTDHPERLGRRVKTVYVGPQLRVFTITNLFEHKPGLFVLSLEGVQTREEAEELHRAEVFIHEKQAAPLAKDEYFIHQLYGLLVVTDDGVELGHVKDVLSTGANDVLVVPRPGQPDALIPVIRDVVQQLDIAGGKVIVHLIPGLLD